MLRILKRLFMVLILLVVLGGIAIALFVSFAPQFGKAPLGEDLERIRQSPNYGESEFVNLIETKMDLKPSKAKIELVSRTSSKQ